MEHPTINIQQLVNTAGTLAEGNKGLLVMDESNPTRNKRFANLGIFRKRKKPGAFETLEKIKELQSRGVSGDDG